MKPKFYRKKASRRLVPKPDRGVGKADAGAHQVVQNVLRELPGLLAVAVVDVASGASLAAHANSLSITPTTAAAYNAEVVRQKQKALLALHLADEQIEDILVTLTSQLHLLRLTTQGNLLLYLAVNTTDTSLAVAREVLRSQARQLELQEV